MLMARHPRPEAIPSTKEPSANQSQSPLCDLPPPLWPLSFMRNQFQPAEKPTMYFIGVTTSKSSINQIFPLWTEYLKLGNCELKGIDFQLHDRPELYREA